MNEFDAIARYFRWPTPKAALGPGDDCALLQTPPGHQLAVSSDMLVSGRHFFANTNPEHLGHKALAVNLSDLAAMGAQPVGFTLALALPSLDDEWLQSFACGMRQLADEHGCELIGGDTTAGPLTISITVFGDVPSGQALRRDGARVGDDIYVSGHLGDARLALQQALGQSQHALSEQDQALIEARMQRPTPRVALGLALRGLASATMDVSDGLAGDIQHILQASSCGADIHLDSLPLSAALLSLPSDAAQDLAANGGDDYELLFCAPPETRKDIAQLAQALQLPLTRIGQTTPTPGLRMLDGHGQDRSAKMRGFDHFA